MSRVVARAARAAIAHGSRPLASAVVTISHGAIVVVARAAAAAAAAGRSERDSQNDRDQQLAEHGGHPCSREEIWRRCMTACDTAKRAHRERIYRPGKPHRLNQNSRCQHRYHKAAIVDRGMCAAQQIVSPFRVRQLTPQSPVPYVSADQQASPPQTAPRQTHTRAYADSAPPR